MNILLLSQFFSTTRGGGEYIFSVIAKNLAQNDHKVWVITNKIVDEQYNVHDNIKLIFVSPTLKYEGGLPPGFLDNIRYFVNAILAGIKLIKKEKIELIHSNNFTPALVGSILSSLKKISHIIAVWDIFTLCGKDYWQKWAKQKGVSKIHSFLGPKIEKLILKLNHNAIHTISESSKDDLMKFGAKKHIHIILPTIENINQRTDPLNSLQFVYVGRLVFYKNLEVVIKAINIAKRKEPKIKLVIVGDGPHKQSLKNLTKKLDVESNVEFKGYVSSDEKTKLIASSSALVFPSLCEGFGLVILEAFAQNKPVLVANQRPLSDIISHEKTGYVLDPYDENVWSEYILKITKNPEKSSVMGKNGNDLLKTTYGEGSMYQNIIKMYSEVLNHT